MSIEKIYLSGEFDFQAAESIVKTACQSSRHLIALIPDEQMTRPNKKLWRAYLRRVRRDMDGLEFFQDEDANELADAVNRNAETMTAIATRADEMLATLEQLEHQLSAGTIDPCEAFVQFITPRQESANPDRQELVSRNYVLDTFKGNQECLYQTYRAIISPNPAAFANIWARQQYKESLGHMRVLQNMRLLERVGLDPISLNPQQVIEFGPGMGGLYPFFLGQGAEVEVVDKNSALRYIALQRGAKFTHDIEFGRSDNFKDSPSPMRESTDFLVGIGILNIFSYESTNAYEQTVHWLTSLIKPGKIGFWLMYNQPSSKQRELVEEVQKKIGLSREVFAGNGWEDVTEEALAGKLNTVGLNYGRNADFRIFVHRKVEEA